MAEIQLQTFLEQKGTAYGQHQDKITSLNQIWEHQRNIQTRGQIPKKYQPRNVPKIFSQINTTIDFKKEFEAKFFKQLDTAIAQNTITLMLEKESQSSIICQALPTTASCNSLQHKYSTHESQPIEEILTTSLQPTQTEHWSWNNHNKKAKTRQPVWPKPVN